MPPRGFGEEGFGGDNTPGDPFPDQNAVAPPTDPVAGQLRSQLEPFTSGLPKENRDNLVQVYTDIAKFLVDRNRVMQRLRDLDNEASDALKDPADPHKAFGEFLDEFERTWGFNRAATEDEGRQPAVGGQEDQNADAAATLLDFVQPQSFLDDLIQRGYQWNDPGAGVGHGEFTHRIQWYLIAKEIEAKGINTRGLDLVNDVYKGLATPGLLSREGVGQEGVGQSLWDVLVDRQKKPNGDAGAAVWPETMYPEDDKKTPGKGDSARSPEFLNTWMTRRDYTQGSKFEFPSLGKFINNQTGAREQQEDQSEAILARLADRYFGGDRNKLGEYVKETGADASNIFRVPPPGYGQGNEPDLYPES